jgi:hypothetical protein
MWHTFLVRFGGAPMVYSLGVVLVLPWGCPARLAAQGGCLAAQGGRFVGSLGRCLGILWGALGCSSGAPAHLAAQGERFVLSGRAPWGGPWGSPVI